MVQAVCQKWVGDEIIFSVIKKFKSFCSTESSFVKIVIMFGLNDN